MKLELLLSIPAILLLIIANGLFSSADLAIISAHRHRLEQLSNQGHDSGRVALRLARSTASSDLLQRGCEFWSCGCSYHFFSVVVGERVLKRLALAPAIGWLSRVSGPLVHRLVHSREGP